ncbi:MAG: LCP family protein [Actinomycetota bacterium]|nr:LCP family protein [Actinomycetota bacterium]
MDDVLTDGRPAESEGVRIAATRAGQRNGDRAGNRDVGGNGVGGRGAPTASRIEDAPEDTAHTVRPAAVPGARTRRPISPARAKVLRQRRRRRRMIIGVTALLVVLNLLVGSGFVYVQHRLGQIKRLDLPALGGDRRGAVMNVLLVGSDSRANIAGSEASGFGKDEVYGQRSDTIMLLHVDVREHKAAIVSVPRDLYVPIAGTNFSDRVNVAFALGGPDQLVATVQRALAIPIHHYVQVDFVGFKDIVDTVGGVTMYVPYPVRDSGSGLDLGKDGCWQLDGNKGLAWVRSRNMEFLINGTWQADGRGDLGRIERQQDFIRRMMKKALSSGITNPLQLNRLISVGVRDVTFDSALSTKDLTELGRRFSSLDPERVLLRTLPTDPADVDGMSVLKLQTAQAQPLIDLLNGRVPVEPGPTTVAGAETTTAAATTVKPSDVKVRVLNGIGTPGAAGRAGTGLTTHGFVVAERGDAPTLTGRTTISHAPGQRGKAELVQSALLTAGAIEEDATLRSVDVNLVLGADYKGLKPSVSAGASVTTAPPPAAAATTVAPDISPVPLPKGTDKPPC